MKALLSHASGGPDTLSLEDVPEPRPAEGEVLVRVHACGVNYPDTLLIRDLYQVRPQRPFSPGGEIAGVVEEVGAGVVGYAVGDAVIGRCGWGGMTEAVVLTPDRLMHKPVGMPMDDAACFLFTYSTSYFALHNRGALQPGETLLVLGASGGVGSAACELGAAMGARVIAAASTREKLALAGSKGAVEGIVYGTPPEQLDWWVPTAATCPSTALASIRPSPARGVTGATNLCRQISTEPLPWSSRVT